MEKIASLTLSVVGRTGPSLGTFNFCPLAVPPVIRIFENLCKSLLYVDLSGSQAGFLRLVEGNLSRPNVIRAEES